MKCMGPSYLGMKEIGSQPTMFLNKECMSFFEAKWTGLPSHLEHLIVCCSVEYQYKNYREKLAELFHI